MLLFRKFFSSIDSPITLDLTTLDKLRITILHDQATPAVWVLTTIEKLAACKSLIVRCKQIDPLITLAKNSSLIARFAHRVVQQIDKPRFSTDTRKTTNATPPSSFYKYEDDEVTNVDTDIYVVLCEQEPDLTTLAPPTQGFWTVKQPSLTEHCISTLLSRQPFLWTHIWMKNSATDTQWQCIASHALPMQSFSITDILNYTHGSLPNLLLSRLNWFAHGLSPEEFENAQVSDQLKLPGTDVRFYTKPQLNDSEILKRSLQLISVHTCQRIKDRFKEEQWQLGFKFNDGTIKERELSAYTPLTPPADTIWADPHVIKHNDKVHVFFEEMKFSAPHGHIATAVLTENGFEQAPEVALAQEHHLSYPSVFKHQNDFYMVPETAAKRTVMLYKATNFPHGWDYAGTLLDDINVADSTLVEHEGVWWMFTNGMSHPSVDERDQLLLFYTDDLLSGEWQAHPLNPVVTGVDRARMAGPLFVRNGKLHRPSQYGAFRYGFGVNMSRIDVLSKTDYREKVINRIYPTGKTQWIGYHSTVHTEDVTVVDRLCRINRA